MALPSPIFPAPRPWAAEPEDPNQPDGAWQVRASSTISRARTDGPILATHLSRQDAEDIVAGVNKIEAERRFAEEDPLQP